MHVLGDHKPRDAAPGNFAVHQVRRDHAKGVAAGLLSGLRDRPHQPDIARAIDQTPVLRRHFAAKRLCCGAIGGVIPIA